MREASRAGRFGWVMFDWANQPFFTVVTTFIFAPYFTSIVMGDPVRGQTWWGYTQAMAGVCIALLSPMLGAIADQTGPRKPWILFFQALTVLGCIGLWWAQPGAQGAVLALTILAIVAATVGAEFSIVFNNSLLPTLVPPDKAGRLSGAGWGMGYVGGLIALAIVLVMQMLNPLDLDTKAFIVERATGPASALWLIVFVLPMFLFTPDIARSGLHWLVAAREGLHRLAHTVRSVSQYRNPAWFLLAFMLYNDGLQAVISFGGIYAAGTFSWSTTELGIFGILLTVFAMISVFFGGSLDDRIGSKRTVVIAIGFVLAAAIGIASIDRDTILFVVPVVPKAAGSGLFSTVQEQVFFAFALLLGLGMGPMQAASRTMLGRLAPPGMTGEFYGLYALSGKATAFLAPFLIAVATQVSQTQRAALGVILVFLVLGLVLLVKCVREPGR